MKSQSVRAIIVLSLVLANFSCADQVSPGTNAMASVSVTQTAEQLVIRKMKAILIPEVTFRPPATLMDALDFFRSASRDYDDPELPLDQRGVNVILKIAPATSNATASATTVNPEIPAMSARFISFYDALKLVCDVTGMKFRVTGNVVMVVPQTEPEASAQPRSDKVILTVQDQQAAEQRVKHKLKTIVIPKMAFRPPATLVDAIDFLRQASRDYDDPKIPEDERGVNFVLNVTYTGPATSTSETATPSIPEVPAMSVRFVSLYDALKVVCEVTGTKFRVNGNIVTIVQGN